MEIASLVLQAISCFRDCSEGNGKYCIPICHSERLKRSLKRDTKRLKERRNDVKAKVEIAKRQQMRVREEVEGWLEEVEGWLGEVEEPEAGLDMALREEKETQQRCFCNFSPKRLKSRYNLGKQVLEKLKATSVLVSRGNFGEVADMLPPPLVEEMPLEDTVGMDSSFREVWSYLWDQGVGIIGIYGMGGVGKTTLLIKINNELIGSVGQHFDVVIWAEVSRDLNMEKVQDQIGRKLGFPDDRWSSMSQRDKTNSILRVLKTKRFVLLLDDVWEHFNLLEAGVPLPSKENKAKVVLTTRQEDVCNLMQAQRKFKVNCLAWREAWELFQSKVGEEVLQSDPDIPKVAETIVKECCGLPLALITVGLAMRSRRTIEEWRHAATTLRKSAAEFTSMEKKVLSLLKFSFDSLPDDTTKSCFLYCALYPEDFYLDKMNLINAWAGEGFFDQSDVLSEAYNKGRHIIGTLMLACLLESGERIGDNYIKMHDMIRDMALWVISDKGATKGKFLVQVDVKLTKAPAILEWEKAGRISLMNNYIDQLTATPRCPNLLTLNLRCNALKMISDSFFDFMPSLKLLDLSHNKSLEELPISFFELVSLQHLDLSFTGVRVLSLKFRKLTKLKFLYMNNMENLQILRQQVLSKLSLLQRLDLFHSGISDQLEDCNVFSGGNELLMEELDCLPNVQALSFTVKSEHALQKFLRSDKLQNCTYGLDIELCRGTAILRLPKDMRLSWFQIGNCSDLEELAIDWLEEEEEEEQEMVPDNPCNNRKLRARCFIRLGSLIINKCKVLLHLNWLIWVPNLKSLKIANCEAMKKLISDGDGVEKTEESLVFCHLQTLHLHDLPQLGSICSHPLSFLSLRQIHVFDCPKLKKLPFHANSAKDKLYIISGQEAWWNGLQWEDMTLKSTFSPFFCNTDAPAGP